MTFAKEMNHPLGAEFPSHFDNFKKLIARESDRGAILVSASILEESLKGLIIARLLPSDDSDDRLFSGAIAALSTFAARTEMAYRLGIITEDTKRMLNVFRKLRNQFAHDYTVESFGDQSVRDRVANVFSQQPDIYSALLDDARRHMGSVLQEMGSDLDPTEVVENHWPLRATFDLFFAATAAALASLRPNAFRES